MYYSIIPCLKHMSVVVLVGKLWILALNTTKSLHDSLQNWPKNEHKVLMAVQQLALPNVLKKRVLFALKPIGCELNGFIKLLDQFHLENPLIITSVVWTNQGILDLKQTAEALVRDLRFSAIERYKIACGFCLENSIEEIWNEIPENRKKSFFIENYDFKSNEQHQLVYFWTHQMKGQGNLVFNSQRIYCQINYTGKQSTYQYAFEYCAYYSLETAADYFLRKLSVADKEESLRCYGKHLQRQPFPFRTYAIKGHLDIFCVPLSQMTLKKQTFFTEKFPRLVCERAIEWPFQGLFVEKADSLINFLSDLDYEYLLRKLVHKVKLGHQDWNYLELFQDLWKVGKSCHKRYVFDHFIMENLLVDLLQIKGINHAILMLKDATEVEKANIVSYRRDVMLILTYNEMWNVLKVLTEHCKASLHLVNQFQEEFLNRDTTSCAKLTVEKEKSMVIKFIKSLDKFITPKCEIKMNYVWRRYHIEKVGRLKIPRKI